MYPFHNCNPLHNVHITLTEEMSDMDKSITKAQNKQGPKNSQPSTWYYYRGDWLMILMTKYRWIFSQTCHDNATTALFSDWWCSRFRRTTRANTFACSAAVAAAATVRKTRPAPAFWSNNAWCKACLPPGIVNCTHNQIVRVFLVSIEKGSKAPKYAFFEFHMQRLKAQYILVNDSNHQGSLVLRWCT